MRIINWCAKYKAICFFCFFHKFIYAVITKYTAISLTAATAANTITKRLCTNLENFSINALFLQSLCNFFKCCISTSL